MKREYLISIVLVAVVIVLTMLVTQKEPHLEVYTLENIYFIDGLQVTNENNEEVLNFTDKLSLSEYISRRTVEDNRKGFNCLNNGN